MDCNYKCVTEIDKIKAYLSNAKTIAFDFETAPTSAYRNDAFASLNSNTADVTGVSFSVEKGSGIYVPLQHQPPFINADCDEVTNLLFQIMTDKTITKIAHNLSFESMFLYKMGIVPQTPVYDTLTAHLMALKSRYEFNTLGDSGLKKLAAEYFGVDMIGFEELTNGRHFDELAPTDTRIITYTCSDSDYTLRLYYFLNEWFDKNLPKRRHHGRRKHAFKNCRRRGRRRQKRD